MTVFGALNIVGVQNIGPMGPREGKAVVYDWPLYFHLARFGLMLILVALLCRAPNRARGAWRVLLPALLMPLVCSWGFTMTGVSQNAGFLNDSVVIVFFALAALWLLADKLGDLPRLATLIYAAWLLGLAGIAGLIGVSGLGVNLGLIPTGFSAAILLFAAIIAMAGAGVACRKRYSPLRYMLSFFVVLVPGVGGALTFIVGCLMLLPRLFSGSGISSRYLYYHFSELLMPGLIGGTALFVLLLPFLALAIWQPLYRARFNAIFRLPGMNSMDAQICSDTHTGEQEL